MLIILFFLSYSMKTNQFCIDQSITSHSFPRKSELTNKCPDETQLLNANDFFSLMKTYKSQSISLNIINFPQDSPLQIDCSQSSIINYSIEGLQDNNFVHFTNIKKNSSFLFKNLNVIINDTILSINSLNISKSTFFSPNGKINLFTHTLITDSISLKQEHFSTIFAQNYQALTNSKPDINVQLLSNDQLIDAIPYSPELNATKRLSSTKRKLTQITDKPISYCLCSKIRFETCKKNLECDLFSIPIENYITGKEDSFKTDISNSDNRIIRMYVTGCEGIPINLGFEDFKGRNNTFYFLLVNSYRPAIISINGKFMSSSPSQDRVFSLVFNNIDKVIIDKGVVKHLDTVILKQSPLTIKLANDLTIPRLFTDSYSIAFFEGTLHITEFISLNGSVPHLIEGTIVLEEGSVVYSPQISLFPYVFISDESITFCDSDQDNDLVFNFAEVTDSTKSWTFYLENSKSTEKQVFPTVTFFLKTNPETNLPLHFLVGLMAGGISMKFDDLSKLAKYTHFTFETYDEIDNFVLALDIDYLDPPVNHPFKEISGNFNVSLMSPKTIEYFFTHLNPDSCLNDPQEGQCDLITFGNLTNLTLYVYNELLKVVFKDQQFEMLFDTFELIFSPIFSESLEIYASNETDIVLSIDQQTQSIPKFVMIMEKPQSTIVFDDSFAIFNLNLKSIIENIIFYHDEKNINFVSQSMETIPMIVVYDPVPGVLFDTSTNKQYNITSSTDFSQSFRSGPQIIVNIVEPNLIIPQNAFLAQEVIFRGSSFSFLFFHKSRSSYIFENEVTILIENETNMIKTILDHLPYLDYETINSSFGWLQVIKNQNYETNLFGVTETKFIGNGKISQTTNTRFLFVVEKLECEFLASIDESNFVSPIIVYDTFKITDPSLERLYISTNSIRLVDSNHHSTFLMKGKDEASFEIVINSANKHLQVSVDSDFILSHLTIIFLSSGELFLDQSWFSIQNPGRLLLTAYQNVTIRTELLTMPKFSSKLNNGARLFLVTNKPGFTSMKAFGIFVALVVIAVIFCIVFCIIDFSHKFPMIEDNSDSSETYELDEIKIVSGDDNEPETKLKTSNPDFGNSFEINQTASTESLENQFSANSEEKKEVNDETLLLTTENSDEEPY